ncbi:MAG TPA: DUF3175 domain-containing protein [Planctomycetaceae bacterium]|nr:DUF3175 domain-containing protein [Planctomycetaceae bacterium]
MATRPGKRKRSHKKGTDKRWVARVKTVSTFPPRDTFNKDSETVARVMASKKVSPKGIGSGIRMIQYFINRAGKNLPAARKRELEKAKRILQERLRNEKARSLTRRKSKSRAT